MAELMNINPLIDAGGDTYKVQSVIRTLRALIDKAGGIADRAAGKGGSLAGLIG